MNEDDSRIYFGMQVDKNYYLSVIFHPLSPDCESAVDLSKSDTDRSVEGRCWGKAVMFAAVAHVDIEQRSSEENYVNDWRGTEEEEEE